MKKVITFIVLALILTSCGVGTYSVSSGREDKGMLSFASVKQEEITVTVDGVPCEIKTVKEKAWRRDKKIKSTAKNTISIAPGRHRVSVVKGGDVIYEDEMFISAQEHKIIEL